MDRWEYKQITLSTSPNSNARNEEKLNELGERGWEVCCSFYDAVILKRKTFVSGKKP